MNDISLTERNVTRINKLKEDKWIGYTQATLILEKLEDLMFHPKVHRMPNMVILGETNNGKTSVIKRFLKRHPAINDSFEDATQVPVVSIEMPPEANQDSIYISILRELYVPFQRNARKDEKFNQIKSIVERLNIRMLMIDEFHTLLDNNVLRQTQVLNTIKYLGNSLQIPIVAAGTKEAHRALLSDSQLSNRFKPYELSRWKLDIEFRKLLKSFEKLIALDKPSNLDQRDLAIEIMNMSEGWIGEIAEIIKSAAINAIKDGTEQITLDGLKKLHWITPTRRRQL
ncbi:MAG: TniB family NTP-binding protein [Kangiella sp.]|nr:TniB family NTP-binding protein [Kangiella sp.]